MSNEDPMKSRTNRFHLGTKAETLQRLSLLVQHATILPLVYITFSHWNADREGTLARILTEPWATSVLIVRSSAQSEDAPGSSAAGKYRTIAHVNGRQHLEQAIDEVVASYSIPASQDQVLVQPYISDIRASGVASSIDPSNGAPYYVINWSEGSDTASVTSGRGRHIRTWYGVSGSPDACPSNQDITSITTLIHELETIVGSNTLEIEYGIRQDGTLILFQVRSLKVTGSRLSPPSHTKILQNIACSIAKAQHHEHGNLLGDRTVFGVMPDWNPAEMIGIRPRPLALSLYKTLITDRIWAEVRRTYGYRDVGATPIMIDFFGLPYINVRASFTSLIPAALDEALAEKLITYYLNKLIAHPTLHDKVEFDILISCLAPCAIERIDQLAAFGFSVAERQNILQALRTLTNYLISEQGPWTRDLKRLKQLPTTGVSQLPVSVGRIMTLLDSCKRYGTLPFAGLARAGFVAMEFLNGFVKMGILSPEQKSHFLAEIGNVTSILVSEFHMLTKEQFLARYGHLRPGTYDILSPCYKECPEKYFDWSLREEQPVPQPNHFELTHRQMQAIDLHLKTIGLQCCAQQLWEFMKIAIRGREEAKFEFTRTVSEILENIRLLGRLFDYSPDNMSYLDIGIMASLLDERRISEKLAQAIQLGQEKYNVTCSITLPPLIIEGKDVWGFELPETEPNFVTQKRCIAPVADVSRGDSPEDAIAFIESADPGYDWLFARRIKGLVTAYGGCNSHMAIRALEFGIPAAIGVGEVRFREWRAASTLYLDAGNRCVQIVR